ncbi:hypothetical protein TCAL_16452 [Tigriopus californicus]|uniref:RING-CH-type domain-containing protein n=1 Tax=Tigriopus californicus TaxID=6832 RepID=A0A553NZW7_TIGCA|nr:uncharacterized protein LOC131887463 isoform X2 [Tigriopus californicus]TRY70986.1 hypothetical protein TCAL_16452 [Tigriopus californicus]
MDDEEEKMCLLSEHEDCGAGIAAAVGGQHDDEQEQEEVQFAHSDQPDPQEPNQILGGPIDSDAVMVVNDIISDIEDKPCSGLPTSRSLPTAIHGYECDEDDPISGDKEEDGSGAECHRCVSPRPSSMSFRESRGGRGGEPLIVDVHLPPQRHAEQQRAPPSVPLRPCKHAINRSQKCISDVTNIKSRPKDDRTSDEMSVSGVSQNESNEVFDKIETVTEHPTATHFPVSDSNGASTSMGTNSLESFKNRFRFASESAASFVLHNLPASIKAGFDFKETKDTFHHHNHRDKIDINHDEGIMEQLMQYNGIDPNCPDDFPPNSPAGSKSKYTKVPTENMDYYDIGDYEGYGGNNRGQSSSMGQYQDLPQNDPYASMGSIGSPAHHNFHKDDFENGCGLSQSSSIMSMPVCRICQLPSLEPSNPLISPCRCLGSIRYVHNNCLLKWLEVSSRRRSGPPCCELCQYPYLRHKKFVISNWRYPECSLRDKVLHSFFLFCIIMMIGCAAVTITCFKEARWPYHPPPNKYQQGELSPPEMISLLCAILFFSAFFLAMYVELKAKHTVYQLLCKFFYMNHEWSVEEYDRKRDIIAKKAAVDASA